MDVIKRESAGGENQRGIMYSIILGVKISGRFLSVEMICSYLALCVHARLFSYAVSLRHGNGERWGCVRRVCGAPRAPARARIRWKSSQLH